MNTYNNTLVMPKNYAVVNENEMTYVDGGTQVAVNAAMLTKAYCLAIAPKYCTGFMNYFAVAKEIHAHAVLYYGSLAASAVAKLAGVNISVVNYIKNHSNPIDIGGDNAARRAVFEVIWNYPGI
jgi:hypothetical protein